MKQKQAVVAALRHWWLWRRQFSGGARVLDALYKHPDPWNLDSEEERQRFEATNALIRAHCSRAAAILEVGCGEGLQTRYLAKLAAHVTGFDISPTAVTRARKAMPSATFLAGELGDLLPILPRPHYDVATLCEVLCYIPNPATTVAQVQGLADQVVVTLYKSLTRHLEPMLMRLDFRAGPIIKAGRKRWKTYVWTNPVT